MPTGATWSSTLLLTNPVHPFKPGNEGSSRTFSFAFFFAFIHKAAQVSKVFIILFNVLYNNLYIITEIRTLFLFPTQIFIHKKDFFSGSSSDSVRHSGLCPGVEKYLSLHRTAYDWSSLLNVDFLMESSPQVHHTSAWPLTPQTFKNKISLHHFSVVFTLA